MRISKIEINNFRGLYGSHTIDLSTSGKNLMIYGENGSGKSSLCQALKVFFEAAAKEIDISQYRNIFHPGEPDDGYIKVTFQDNGTSAEFILDKDNQKITEQYVLEANKIKGFLGYKNLLKTHYLTGDPVNLFDLLINELFVHTPDPVTGNPNLWLRWFQLQTYIEQRRNSSEYKVCPEILSDLNQSLKKLLDEVAVKANEIVKQFDYGIKFGFQFPGITIKEAEKTKDRGFENKKILLLVDFHDGNRIAEHHLFLNEARLTAIAISIYFASILIMPQQTPYKILVLDDILIGLDTSNRFPLLNILLDHFTEYQIIMATYDRRWYELVKTRLGEANWAYLEMCVTKQHQQGFEIPVIRNGDFIQIAKDYLAAGDLKASAVYIRSAFEQLLVKYCDNFRTPVKFRIKTEKIPAEDFWQSVKAHDQRSTTPRLDQAMITDVELHRSLVMNPFSHYDLTNPYFRAELQATINTVEQLKNRLA